MCHGWLDCLPIRDGHASSDALNVWWIYLQSWRTLDTVRKRWCVSVFRLRERYLKGLSSFFLCWTWESYDIYWWKLIVVKVIMVEPHFFDPNDDGGNSSTHQDDEVEHISCDRGNWGSQPVDGNFSNHSQDLFTIKLMDFVAYKLLCWENPATHIHRNNNQTTRKAQTASKLLLARQIYTLITGKIMESFERLIWKLSCS